ncbi:MAG: hypothetical protein HZB47_14120 [Nitrosomonadales bacterium]|nr:hypothetical protein [Nitrosomonadales bacterium]
MKHLLLITFLTLLTGCASTTAFTSLPKDEHEFLLPKAQLTEKYTEIPAYEKRWRGFAKQNPTEQSLISELGEPRATRRNWLSPIVLVATGIAIHAQPIVWAIVIAIRPDVPETYYFRKGNYCVEAHMDRSIVSQYSKSMSSWEWKENSQSCE